MAKIKLQGHASGSGIITLTAPNTSTDRVISLPDATATIATTTDVAARLPSITDGGNATAMTINSSENVGIGQTSPSYRLHVETSVDGDFASLIHNTDADNGQGLMIRAGADAGEAILSLRNQASSEKFKVLADGRGLSQFTAKAWVRITDATTITDSHNISSVGNSASGKREINIDVDTANGNGCAVASAGGASSGSSYTYNATTHSIAAGSWGVTTSAHNNGSPWLGNSGHICSILFAD